MNSYIENSKNNKDIQWSDNEKKNSNWFKERWESLKNFLEWKKNDVIWNSSKKSEWLKDLVVDSSLLDMEKWSELSDSEEKTREELTGFFDKWQKDKGNVSNKEKFSQQAWYDAARFEGRSPEAVQEIENSAMKLEDEIKNWDKEENPVAKALYGAVDSIMKTENKA